MEQQNFNSALQKMRKSAMIISLLAFTVSVTYTVLFNIGQANTLFEQILAGTTGLIQDSSEILAFLFGFWLLTAGDKQRLTKIIGWSSILLSVTLVLWSIASTWGANSAMIDSSSAKANAERAKMSLIQDTINQNRNAAQSMQDNADAIREQASQYGKKFISRSIDKIGEAQKVSEEAGRLANRSMSALDRMDNIDTDLIGSVNSAQAAFNRISDALDVDSNTVGTTFLLTRATQLEIIGIITGLFVILVPAGAAKGNSQNSAGTTQNNVPVQQNNQAGASAPTSTNAAGVVSNPAGSVSPGAAMASTSNYQPKTPTVGAPAVGQTSLTPNTTTTGTTNQNGIGFNANIQSSTTPAATPASGATMSAPEAKALLSTINNSKFDEVFVDIATGATKTAIGAARKKHGTGAEQVQNTLVCLEYCGLVSPKNANGQRTLTETIDATEAEVVMGEIKKIIRGAAA